MAIISNTGSNYYLSSYDPYSDQATVTSYIISNINGQFISVDMSQVPTNFDSQNYFKYYEEADVFPQGLRRRTKKRLGAHRVPASVFAELDKLIELNIGKKSIDTLEYKKILMGSILAQDDIGIIEESIKEADKRLVEHLSKGELILL